uniref:Uncharacterized protein n=1 Tax=Nelumbo nucifera TaxID=4432 RepID=A0A822YHC9_NELNU|nr:TPA_asm: hypothetical protein HUJ06_009236 [Nelumbo nucifera]
MTDVLLQIYEDNLVYRTMVSHKRAIPLLVALSQSGMTHTKQKVGETITSSISGLPLLISGFSFSFLFGFLSARE